MANNILCRVDHKEHLHLIIWWFMMKGQNIKQYVCISSFKHLINKILLFYNHFVLCGSFIFNRSWHCKIFTATCKITWLVQNMIFISNSCTGHQGHVLLVWLEVTSKTRLRSLELQNPHMIWYQGWCPVSADGLNRFWPDHLPHKIAVANALLAVVFSRR